MKKIIYSALLACALVALPACDSHDYDEVSKVHVYGEKENPPFKGTDANMPSAGVNIPQGKTDEVRTVNLSDYAAQVEAQLGMSLDQAIAGLNDGSVRFLLGNPARRTWDKTPANGGSDYSWYVSSFGIISDADNGAALVTFNPAAKELSVKITDMAGAGIIPVVAGFVKTDDSAYTTNFRFQTLITVTDASVVEVDVIVPTGDYAAGYVEFEALASNIAYAFDGMTLPQFAAAMDRESGVFTAYLMSSTGQLYGGADKYTANGMGYWMTEACDIVNWGAEGFAMFIEPDIYDWEAEAFYSNGGYLGVGRLSNSTPASGATRYINYVVQLNKDTSKSLTLMITAHFE